MGEYQRKKGSKQADDGSSRIRFDCRFSPSIRRLFRRKRIELGLAYSRLGELFGANWSTIRKWENGPTESCELLYRPLIEAFLNGDYDRELSTGGYRTRTASPERTPAPVPFPIHQCMERMVSTYLLCMHEETITSSMLSMMDEVSSVALQKLIAGGHLRGQKRERKARKLSSSSCLSRRLPPGRGELEGRDVEGAVE